MIKACNTNRREMLKRYLFFLIPCFIIVFVSMYYIDSHISIKITGDEYGYWAAGAYLNGWDWSPITAYNSYYGYGYGLILALILKMGLSSSISYKIAIGFNVFFLLLIYGIVYHLITSFSRENEVPLPLKSLIALAVCLYPGNLAYTQYTMPEVLLSLLYWLIILLLYELLNKVSIIKIFLLVIVVLYCFSVHQRTIGVCFVALLLLLIIVLKKHVNIRLLISHIAFCWSVNIFNLWL